MLISGSSASWANVQKGFSKDFSKGFSLIEIIVSLSILLVLSGIVLSYGRSVANILTLANQQAALLGLISRAKSLSQAFSIADAPASKVICAYGVHVDKTEEKVIIFRDMVDMGKECSDSDNAFTLKADEEIADPINIFYLAQGFEFTDSTDPKSPDLNDVVFIPPDPTVIINNDPTDINDPSVGTKSGSIIVSDESDASRQFMIQITSFGQIKSR